ncbi:MAG TPA: hypothetical protein VIK89_02875 [Cytophagaceae bacterium]
MVKILVILLIPFSVVAQTTVDFKTPTVRIWNSLAVGKGEYNQPHPSAYLDIGGDKKGVKLPAGDYHDVSNPAKGLVFFHNEDSSIYLFDGYSWVKIISNKDSFIINYIDSITAEIPVTKSTVLTVSANTNTIYDPVLEGAEILNVDRNGFNESDFFQQPNWMLYFPDGLFAGERLNILYNTKAGFGGGGGSPGGFTYPFVWIGTATGNIVTLPTNINFILTVDVGSITLIPSEYSYIDNQITIDNSIDLSTLIRVIYW